MVRTLGMFVRHPVPGAVKTRLARTVGDEAAAALYAAFVDDLAARCRPLAERFVWAYTPDTAAARQYFEQRCVSGDILWRQPEEDLGARMACFFEAHLTEPSDRVVLIGSDAPTLGDSILTQAFQTLTDHEAVIGPAEDGGYVLIGFSGVGRAFGVLTEPIVWGTSTVRAMTVEKLAASGVSAELLPLHYDIDESADLTRLMADLADPAQRSLAPRTARVLAELARGDSGLPPQW